jgi:putative ABC transport system ATP-binding protein
MLKIIDLKKSFGEQMVFANLNLEAKPGLLTILEGQNGAGKSTLFNILSGTLPKDQGQILLNESPLNSFENVAILHQDPKSSSSPSLSVMENLILFLLKSRRAKLKAAVRPETKRQVMQHLETLGLHTENFQLPMGRLSGGQRQILAFAMVTLNKAQLLLLDEPTAALDEQMSHKLMTLIKELVRSWQIPAMMISHDHGLNQKYGDKIVVLKDGHLFTSF